MWRLTFDHGGNVTNTFKLKFQVTFVESVFTGPLKTLLGMLRMSMKHKSSPLAQCCSNGVMSQALLLTKRNVHKQHCALLRPRGTVLGWVGVWLEEATCSSHTMR